MTLTRMEFDGEYVHCALCGLRYRRSPSLQKAPLHQCTVNGEILRGVGEHLHALIKFWSKEDITPNCDCAARIAKMNHWGPAGCREHLAEIVGWLEEEATARKMRVHKWPGGRLGIKAMILLAIYRAERDERRFKTKRAA